MALSQRIENCEMIGDFQISSEISKRLFKIQIVDENIKLVETKLKEGNFENDFQWIHEDASKFPDLPAYYLINCDTTFDEFVMITFVPDIALPAVKMKYAYCIQTLRRKLPHFQIKLAIFASTLDELLYSSYLENTLKKNTEINPEENDSSPIVSKSYKLPGMHSNNLSFPITEEAISQLKELRDGEVYCLALSIENENFNFVKSWNSLPDTPELSSDRPYYLVSRIAESKDYVFIYVCAESIKPQEKMTSAAAKQSLLMILQETLSANIERKEAQSPEDAKECLVEPVSPPLLEKEEKKFLRPKPPGRPRTLRA